MRYTLRGRQDGGESVLSAVIIVLRFRICHGFGGAAVSLKQVLQQAERGDDIRTVFQAAVAPI